MALDREIIAQYQALLATNRRTLAHLLQQAAQYGGEVFAPPQTINGIAAARAQIQSIKANLRTSGEPVEDEPGDEARVEAVHVEGVILGLGEQIGAIVVYTRSDMRGKQIEASNPAFSEEKYSYKANVVERVINGRREFAAIFPRLPARDYSIYYRLRGDIKRSTLGLSVFSGEVAEVDWR